jgi:DNA-binding NtrC family response regulator
MSNIDRVGLQNALTSPLRLRLVTELLDAHKGMTVEEAVFQTGRHEQDIVACLRPMIHWGVVEIADAERRLYRLAPDLPPWMGEVLRAACERRADTVERERFVRHNQLCGMIGVDPKMLVVFESVMQLARLEVPVLIIGETGTGKEMVARAIHELGDRRSSLFGAINCGTLTSELFATEMLGHVRGAFTGAVRDHPGLVERADGGTLFLDEIGDLAGVNQVKFLRVLQEGTFRRVGDERTRNSNFRVISATNRNLETLVENAEFREDLYYRLNVYPLRLPSLRERLVDPPLLCADLLNTKLAPKLGFEGTLSVDGGALARLSAHAWPGNIHELENVMMRALVASGGRNITADHIPPLGRATGAPTAIVAKPPIMRTLAEVENEHIAQVLDELDGNLSAAARVLGISRSTLYNRIKVIRSA